MFQFWGGIVVDLHAAVKKKRIWQERPLCTLNLVFKPVTLWRTCPKQGSNIDSQGTGFPSPQESVRLPFYGHAHFLPVPVTADLFSA